MATSTMNRARDRSVDRPEVDDASTRPADGGRHGRPGFPRPGRIEGLDGLRALAIAGVLVYHLDPAWLPGGFLGVDVFFVVSGFLITTLLVREHGRTGRIAFGQFWLRRARRLLPALVLCVVTSVLIARLVSEDLLVHVGRQIAGALTFSTNWVEITAGSSYFDQTAPQLFMNFWSLAVEEQFYLLWPALTLALLALGSGRVRVAAAAAIGGASALLMAALFSPDADPTRVYYGTDTHVMGLMAGAALAFAWSSPSLALRVAPSRWGRYGAWAVPVAGVVLVGAMLLLDEQSPWTFRGGIVIASLATAVLVMGVLDRRSGGPDAFQRVVRHPLATWVGARSYSIYLWHWPVILLVGLDNPSAPGTTWHGLTRLWCVLVTLALADLTFRFVETPFRTLGFRGVGRRVGGLLTGLTPRGRRIVAGVTAALVLGTTVVVVTAPDMTETARMLAANEAGADASATTPRATGTGTPAAPRQGSPATTTPARPSASATTAPPGAATATRTSAFTMPSGPEIDAYGDSIMVGSLQALRYYFPGIRIDARSNRRWSDGLAQVRARGEDNRRAVVLAFGTNAGVDADRVEDVLSVLGPNRMVVLVNVMGPFSRIDSDNAALALVASRHPNVVVADWADAVRAHPDQVQSDRVHPTLTGAHLFSKTVRQALADLSERSTGTKVVLKDLPIP